MVIRYALAFVIMGLLACPGVCGELELGGVLEPLEPDSGISSDIIQCSLQDRRGYLWFGTLNGLNRYDGYGMKVYLHEPGKPGSLSDSVINCLLEDGDGVLWIGTEKGLHRFEESSETFTFIEPGEKERGNPLRTRMLKLFEDRGGTVWAAAMNGNIFKVNKKSLRSKRYVLEPGTEEEKNVRFIYCFYEDKNGTLWIGHTSGLACYDKKKDGFVRCALENGKPGITAGKHITSIHEDAHGNMLFGTVRNGLYVFDKAAGVFRHIPHDASKRFNPDNNEVTSIAGDKRGNIWLGTANGIHTVDWESGTYSHYLLKTLRPVETGGNPNANTIGLIRRDRGGSLWFLTQGAGNFRLDSDSGKLYRYRFAGVRGKVITSCFFQDRSGVLWFGTFGHGVFKYDPQRSQFKHFGPYDVENPGLSHPIVGSILQDRDGQLWFGTYGGGLNRWEKETGRFIHYKHGEKVPGSISGNFISCLARDRDGNLWAGELFSGLNRMNPGTGTFTRFRHDPADPGSLGGNGVVSLLVDGSGTLWIGTGASGISRLDPGSSRFISYRPQPGNPGSIGGGRVYWFLEDQDGHFWVATYNGLYLMDRQKGTFKRFGNEPGNTGTLSDQRVVHIMQDRKGNLWISTFFGLNCYNPKTRAITRYVDKQSGTLGLICGVVEDSKGNLWYSCGSGLTMYNPGTREFYRYPVNDGRYGKDFTRGAVYKDLDGQLFFGGSYGFVRFLPGKIKRNAYVPPVIISECKRFGKSVTFDKPLPDLDRVEFSYDDAFISFQFAALSFSNSKNNRYAYKLEGMHDRWIPLGTRRSIDFAGLNPGSYTLKVKGSNSSGVWNEQGASLDIIIHPPFWQTWWFRGIIVLLVLAGALFWHRKRMDRMTRELNKKARIDFYMAQRNISTRELEIIHLVLEGKSNKDIEDQLYISSHTVKNHIYHIYKKLNIKNRFQLISMVQEL